MSGFIDVPAKSISEGKKSWHVIYVKARHEKSAYSELLRRGIEAYLPLRKELHQWSDRKRWIEVPLFSSYIFVRTLSEEFNVVYLTSGFVKFITSNGKPSTVPDNQIEDVRRVVDYYTTEVEVLDGSYKGFEAEVTAGALTGLRGEIIELVNGRNFVIRIEGLDKLLSVKVPVNAVRLIDAPASMDPIDPLVGEASVTSITS